MGPLEARRNGLLHTCSDSGRSRKRRAEAGSLERASLAFLASAIACGMKTTCSKRFSGCSAGLKSAFSHPHPPTRMPVRPSWHAKPSSLQLSTPTSKPKAADPPMPSVLIGPRSHSLQDSPGTSAIMPAPSLFGRWLPAAASLAHQPSSLASASASRVRTLYKDLLRHSALLSLPLSLWETH